MGESPEGRGPDGQLRVGVLRSKFDVSMSSVHFRFRVRNLSTNLPTFLYILFLKVLAGFAKIIAAMEILQGLREEAYLALANKVLENATVLLLCAHMHAHTLSTPNNLSDAQHLAFLFSVPSLFKRYTAVGVGDGGSRGYLRT